MPGCTVHPMRHDRIGLRERISAALTPSGFFPEPRLISSEFASPCEHMRAFGLRRSALFPDLLFSPGTGGRPARLLVPSAGEARCDACGPH